MDFIDFQRKELQKKGKELLLTENYINTKRKDKHETNPMGACPVPPTLQMPVPDALLLFNSCSSTLSYLDQLLPNSPTKQKWIFFMFSFIIY